MAKADNEKKDDDEKKASNVVRIKYMGASDERYINKEDTFGGRVPDGIGVDLAWTVENGHICEVEGLDPEVLDLLLKEQYERDGVGSFINAFKDVTGAKTVPDNEHQKRWKPRGLPDARTVSAVVNGPDAAAVGGGAVVGSGLTAGATGSTIAGGSTGGPT